MRQRALHPGFIPAPYFLLALGVGAFLCFALASHAAQGGEPGAALYVVVLKRAASAGEAIEDAREMRKLVPSARAVMADKRFYVVLGEPPAERHEALVAAARAKHALADRLEPMLIEAKAMTATPD